MSRKSVMLSTRTVNKVLLDESESGTPLQKKIVAIMLSNLLFDGIEDLVPPTFLSNQTGSFKLAFKLSTGQAEKIGMGRDFSVKPPHHQFRVILRTCRFFKKSFELDCYNGISAITVNNTQLSKLQDINNRPLDITTFLKISPLSENVIYLDRNSASQPLVVGVYFVSRATADAIVGRMIKNPRRFLTPDWTRNKLSAVQFDEGFLFSEFSLVCPLSQKRYETPVRGKDCQHLACFDAESYINLGLSMPKNEWHCPICHANALPADLVVDGFCMDVLKKLESEGDGATKIRMCPNGEWTPVRSDSSVTTVEIDGPSSCSSA